MSTKEIIEVLLRRGMHPRDIVGYIWLMEAAQEAGGELEMSLRQMMRAMGVGERRLIRILRNLERAGLIRVIRGHVGYLPQANRYIVVPPEKKKVEVKG